MIVTSLTGSTTPASVIAQATDWRTAVTDLIAWLVANGRCFSSGEIAAYLRTYRSDLAFEVRRLGEYVREAYDNGTIPSYDDGAGGTVYPTQVARVCNGVATTLDGRRVITKTPVGTTVLVYAKDGADGFAHDFEIFVPDWDDPQATRATPYTGGPLPVPAPQVTVTPPPASAAPGAAPTVSAPPSAQVGVLITGALKADDVIAYVRPDRRLCVPRAAFEAFVALTGVPLRGGPQGDPVFVTIDGTKVTITRDCTPTSQEYHLWVNRGRIAVANIPGAMNPGEKFKITVTATSLTIELGQKV